MQAHRRCMSDCKLNRNGSSRTCWLRTVRRRVCAPDVLRTCSKRSRTRHKPRHAPTRGIALRRQEAAPAGQARSTPLTHYSRAVTGCQRGFVGGSKPPQREHQVHLRGLVDVGGWRTRSLAEQAHNNEHPVHLRGRGTANVRSRIWDSSRIPDAQHVFVSWLLANQVRSDLGSPD